MAQANGREDQADPASDLCQRLDLKPPAMSLHQTARQGQSQADAAAVGAASRPRRHRRRHRRPGRGKSAAFVLHAQHRSLGVRTQGHVDPVVVAGAADGVGQHAGKDMAQRGDPPTATSARMPRRRASCAARDRATLRWHRSAKPRHQPAPHAGCAAPGRGRRDPATRRPALAAVPQPTPRRPCPHAIPSAALQEVSRGGCQAVHMPLQRHADATQLVGGQAQQAGGCPFGSLRGFTHPPCGVEGPDAAPTLLAHI